MTSAATPAGPELQRRILALAVPAMLTNIATALIGLVDLWVVGQLGNAIWVAAVGMGSTAFWLTVSALNFLRTGTTGLTAQALGRADAAEGRAILLRALVLGLLLGMVLLAGAPWLLEPGLALFNAEPAVTAASHDYLAIRWWALPLALVNFAAVGWLLGHAHARTVLAVEVGYNLTNAALSILLVLGLGLGIAGLAWASAAAELAKSLALAACIAGLAGRSTLGAAMAQRGVFALTALRRLWSVNGNLFARTLALMFTIFLFNRLSAQQGATIQAANYILFQLFMLATLMLDGFEVSAQVMCGARAGARDCDGFRRVTFATLKTGMMTALLLAAGFAIAGGVIIGLFAPDAATREAARAVLPWLVLLPLAGAPSFVYDGVYIGATWTRAMLLTMLLGTALMLLLVPLMHTGLANHGLWLAYTAFLLGRSTAQALWTPALIRRGFA